SFRDNLGRVTSKGAIVLGVSRDDTASHVKFREKYDLNFPLLSDDKGRVTEAYGVWKKKNLYGREYFGIERTTFLIDEGGKIARIWPKVRVEGHTDEVVGEGQAILVEKTTLERLSDYDAMSAGYEIKGAQEKHVLQTVLSGVRKPEKSEFWKVLFRWL